MNDSAQRSAFKAEIDERQNHLMATFLRSLVSKDVAVNAVTAIIESDMKTIVAKAEALGDYIRNNTTTPEEAYIIIGATIPALCDLMIRGAPEGSGLEQFDKIYTKTEMVEMRAMIDMARLVHTVMAFVNMVHSRGEDK